jgi:predicted transcriptional regulator
MSHNNRVVENTLIIEDLETLKVLADQMRHQVFEVLLSRPQTIREVAEKLGYSAKKLYYHFTLLEQHGLIKVAATNMVGNLQEKQYAVTASNLVVSPKLLAGSSREGVGAWLASILNVTQEDILRNLQTNTAEVTHGQSPDYGQLLLSRSICQIPAAQVEIFRQRLKQLIDEFDALDVPDARSDANLEPYALTVAYYPIHHFPAEPVPENERANAADSTSGKDKHG